MRALLLCLLLGGCSCLTQKVERVEVPVPVVTTCVRDIPAAPKSRMVPGTNIERLAAAASADARELVLYAEKLNAILNACKESQ